MNEKLIGNTQFVVDGTPSAEVDKVEARMIGDMARVAHAEKLKFVGWRTVVRERVTYPTKGTRLRASVQDANR